jgi:hypothetical protein
MPARYPGARPEASGQAGLRAPPQGHDQRLKKASRNNVDMPPAAINVEKKAVHGVGNQQIPNAISLFADLVAGIIFRIIFQAGKLVARPC